MRDVPQLSGGREASEPQLQAYDAGDARCEHQIGKRRQPKLDATDRLLRSASRLRDARLAQSGSQASLAEFGSQLADEPHSATRGDCPQSLLGWQVDMLAAASLLAITRRLLSGWVYGRGSPNRALGDGPSPAGSPAR
jgi:hypothetical protein